MLLVVAGAAHAAQTFYWYGANPDCWQTGTNPGAPGESCDYPGGGLISGAITGDLNANASGDYCNTYYVNNTICNNEAADWPLSFKYTSACETDSPACGIQHYVSFAEQNDHPWAVWANAPQLVLSSELAMTGEKAPFNAWAYLCAVLQAPGTKNFLEDCFDRWQESATQENLPNPPFAASGYGLSGMCQGVTINGVGGAVDQVITAFAPNAPTPFGTTIAGTTVTGGKTGTIHFQVAINTAQLESTIARDNQAQPTGCSRGLPNDISDYRLVGIEDGIEGGKHTQLTATTSHLQAWTEYVNINPPTATTESATNITQTTATLPASVNPNGSDTHYYFQYGETTSYGSTTPETDLGTGTTSESVGTNITGLTPGTTYHYRIVASNWVDTSYGKDKTLLTLGSSHPVVLHEGGDWWVFYRGGDGALWEESYSSGGSWSEYRIGSQIE